MTWQALGPRDSLLGCPLYSKISCLACWKIVANKTEDYHGICIKAFTGLIIWICRLLGHWLPFSNIYPLNPIIPQVKTETKSGILNTVKDHEIDRLFSAGFCNFIHLLPLWSQGDKKRDRKYRLITNNYGISLCYSFCLRFAAYATVRVSDRTVLNVRRISEGGTGIG